MGLTDNGKNHIFDMLLGTSTEVLINGGFGVDPDFFVSDTNLQSSVVLLDDAEATTGWSAGADALTPSSDTTNFQEGSASIKGGTTFSAGDAYYSKTVSAVDLSASLDKGYLFVYVETLTDLDDVDGAVYVELGTGGFTNANRYDFARSGLTSGWNGLLFTVATVSSTIGSGATESSIDSVKVGFTSSNTITGGDLKFDYIRGVVDGSFGFGDSIGTFTTRTSDKSMQITYKALSTTSNGYGISSAGLSTTSLLFSKAQFTAINKTQDIEVQMDEFITIK